LLQQDSQNSAPERVLESNIVGEGPVRKPRKSLDVQWKQKTDSGSEKMGKRISKTCKFGDVICRRPRFDSGILLLTTIYS
jgi:hypothetical protein